MVVKWDRFEVMRIRQKGTFLLLLVGFPLILLFLFLRLCWRASSNLENFINIGYGRIHDEIER